MVVMVVVVVVTVFPVSLCVHFHGGHKGFHLGQVSSADSNLKTQLSFASCLTLGESFNFLVSDYTPTKWASEPFFLCVSQD